MSDQNSLVEKRNIAIGKVRNIGIIAHIDAGKTTTTERVLFYTGRTYKIGDIDEGTTQMDWMVQERERGITIVSAATTTFWRDHRLNIIDTPGHVDFTAEVERSLRVLDGAVMIFDSVEGVQSQSETVWRQADKYNVPRLCFMNKMDALGANFDYAVGTVRDRLNAKPAIITYPIGKEKEFIGVIHILKQKALTWDTGDQGGEKFNEKDIPLELQAKAKELYAQLIELVSENDDVLMEKYLEGKEPTLEELMAAIRRATIANKIVPLYAGSSLRNKGVQPILDGVIDFLPSPIDVPSVTGVNPDTSVEEKRSCDPKEPLSSLAFKIQSDPHVGRLTYIRIYSGTLNAGEEVFNTHRGRSERIGRLLIMHANEREMIDKGVAGEIVAAIGLKDATTGDTLCDKNKPIVLESITFPEPVISLAIEPKTKADQEKLGFALNRLSDEDPTFRISSDQETSQTIISGMGELHLDIIVDRLKREFGVEANTGQPQVAYRETINHMAEGEGKYIRQSGGRGQYGHCWLRVEPLTRGEGNKFENEIRGTAIPSTYIPAIEKGVKEAMERGVLAGYPLVDVRVAVYDGSYHEVDSSEMSFKIAGSLALQEASKNGGLKLLEPIMKLEVTTPDEFMGEVIGDLSAKRAQITSTEQKGNVRVIVAFVPLSEVRGYATSLRSQTQGRASFYMEPSHYEDVPANISQKIIEARSGVRRIAR